MKLTQSFDTERMWRACIDFFAGASLCTLIDVFVMSVRAPSIVPAGLTAFLISSMAFFLSLWMRHKSNSPLAQTLFFSEVIVLLALILMNHEYYVRTTGFIQPYLGIKLLATYVAIIAPPWIWLGWSSFALMIAAPLAQYYSWDAALEIRVGIQEPWGTVMFVIAAGILYYNRLQVFSLARKHAVAATRAGALKRMAHLLLGARHLSNTPLQTIEITNQLLKNRHPLESEGFDTIDRAVSSVRNVNQLLAFGEDHLHWDSVNLPQSLGELEKEIKALTNDFESDSEDL